VYQKTEKAFKNPLLAFSGDITRKPPIFL